MENAEIVMTTLNGLPRSWDSFILISALTGNITHGSDDWLIDSGASKHMTGFKESFVRLSEHEARR